MKVQTQRLKDSIFARLFGSADSTLSRRIRAISARIEHQKWLDRLQEAGLFDVDRIFTYTSVPELRTLYELASSRPPGAVALEIGSHLGASSCYLAAGLKQVSGHLFCVDTWENQTMPEGEQDTFGCFQDNTKAVACEITPIRKKSTELDKDDLPTPIDLVFIDGDHSYQGVKQDFLRVREWLKEGGILAFHDFGNVHFSGVSRTIGEALASGDWVVAGQVDTLVWIERANWITPPWLTRDETLNETLEPS